MNKISTPINRNILNVFLAFIFLVEFFDKIAIVRSTLIDAKRMLEK
jgi:hypothetical protein